MPQPYATVEDYLDWVGDLTPYEQPRPSTMRKASDLISSVLIGAVYATDEDGNATHPTIVEALRDATCAQVEFWDETGDESGASSVWQSASIGGASYTRAAGGARLPVAPAAVLTLRRVGLLPVVVGVPR